MKKIFQMDYICNRRKSQMSNDMAWAENTWEHQEPPEDRFIKDEDEDDEE